MATLECSQAVFPQGDDTNISATGSTPLPNLFVSWRPGFSVADGTQMIDLAGISLFLQDTRCDLCFTALVLY